MLNEIEEFENYTKKPKYISNGKSDYTYLGRFTWEMLFEFYGFLRILTIIARGYMFSEGRPDIDRAHRALCAWCSIPEKKSAKKAEWEYSTCFAELNDEFPELVSKKGEGWFVRHIRHIIAYVEKNKETVSKAALKNCTLLKKGFDEEWRSRVVRMQIPLFTKSTKAKWAVRFDDVLADALDSGALENKDFELPEDVRLMLSVWTPPDVPEHVLPVLYKYYLVNRKNPGAWVVLPVKNFDAYFATSSFSKVWLSRLPKERIVRETSYGVCRYKIN